MEEMPVIDAGVISQPKSPHYWHNSGTRPQPRVPARDTPTMLSTPLVRLQAVLETLEFVVTSQHNCFALSTLQPPPPGDLPVHRGEDAGEPTCNYQYNFRHGKRQGVCALQFQNQTACTGGWQAHYRNRHPIPAVPGSANYPPGRLPSSEAFCQYPVSGICRLPP